jgi:hypothetical protein
MLAAASRYVCGRVQQHIAESSSTDLGGPGMSRRHADNALATRRQADDDSQASAEKAQHPLDPCVEGRMRTGRREDAANHSSNHSSQGESNDCWSRRRFR